MRINQKRSGRVHLSGCKKRNTEPDRSNRREGRDQKGSKTNDGKGRAAELKWKYKKGTEVRPEKKAWRKEWNESNGKILKMGTDRATAKTLCRLSLS